MEEVGHSCLHRNKFIPSHKATSTLHSNLCSNVSPSTSYFPIRGLYLVPGPSVCHEGHSCAPYPAFCEPAILLCLTGMCKQHR